MENTYARKNYHAILFDLDGTLLDSFTVHYRAYQIMFSKFGIQFERELYLKTYSPDWYKTYEAFNLPRENWELANRYWEDAVEEGVAEVFPGVVELLQHLNKKFKLGLVTSGSKDRVIMDLDRTGLANYFKTVITGNDVTRAKPDPQGLQMAMDHLSVKAVECIYIGDAAADYQMAQAAGVDFIGITSAYGNLKPVDSEFPLVQIDEVLKLFNS